MREMKSMKKTKIYKGFLKSQSEFSHLFATWAHNHRGWAKAKRINKRIAKRKERVACRKELSGDC